MKNIITILLLLISSFVTAQIGYFTEAIIKSDSILSTLYYSATEGCEKSIGRYREKNGQSCPVFIDEQGFVFYVRVSNKRLEFVDL